MFKVIFNSFLGMAALVLLVGQSLHAHLASDENRIRKLLLQPADKIDLLEIKLAVDKSIDPSIDIDATRKQFENMVLYIRQDQPLNLTSSQNLRSIRMYLYGRMDLSTRPFDWGW